MIFGCSDFGKLTCPLKGHIVISCHCHSDDPILEGGQIDCWVDGHAIIINELPKKDEKAENIPDVLTENGSFNCAPGAECQ